MSALTRGQEALWFLWQLDPADPTYHLSAAWRARGPVDAERLRAAWQQVVARHQTLRSAYRVEHGRLQRVELEPAPFGFEVRDGEALDLEGEAARPFDLALGPVTRVALWRDEARGDVLQFTLHHLCSDGLSMRVLAEDLRRAWAGEKLAPPRRTWAEHVARHPGDASGRADAAPTRSEPGWTGSTALEPALAARVRQTAKALGVTPAAVLQAAFRAWLFRLTGERRVAVPMAGRGRGEWEVVGYFSEAREVEVDFDGATAAATLVKTSAHATHAARRSSPAARAFDGLFNMLPRFEPLALAGLVLEPVPFRSGARVQGVGLSVREADDGYHLDWACARPVWSAWVAGWTDCFPVLLDGLCEDPRRRVDELPLLTASQGAVVGAFGDGGPGEVGDVLARLEAHARATPDATAVEGDERLSWRELMARAHRLAPLFAALPAGGVVALCVERSATAVALMLAALEARQGYAFPVDSDPLLHRPTAVVRLAAGPGPALERLVVERRPPAEALCSEEPVGFAVTTSGSTGEPKSVRVGRASFERYVLHAERAFELNAKDRMIQFHALSFDGHVEEVFPVLAAGGTLVLRDELPDAAGFAELVERRGVTTVSLPTGYWAWLAAQALAQGVRLPPSLRLTIVGGEAATAPALEAWRQVAPGARFLNSYGPSEACVVVTTSDDLTLGRPIAGVRLEVRGPRGERVPPGVVGEVCLSGPCLALGVPSPFPTGDLARWLADGRLEFHGRADRQLKVAGRRVEPGLVERALEGAGATRAHVALQGGFLCAWLEGRPPVADLRRGLSALPPHARPTRFALVERFPLTAHGKVDAAALERTPLGPLTRGEARALNAREAAVAQVFAEVLGLSQVAADDDFFALGGDSLKALECSLRLEGALGFPVSLSELYQAPTPEALARREGAPAAPWLDDAHLLDDLPVRPAPRPSRPRQLLFTGATGFLGVHLLAEWLRRSDARVTCLVRAADEREARLKLARAAAAFQLELPPARIDMLVGNLENLPAIPPAVDAVVHAAGLTDLRKSYLELRAANVLAVAQVLRLELPTHLLSSSSAVGEADAPPSTPYGCSKWVGERLAERARASGVPVWVHRPGRIWGAAALGTTPVTDALFAAVLAGHVSLEAALAQVTPVDRFAAQVVTRMLDAAPGTSELPVEPPLDRAPYQAALQRAGAR